MLRIERGSQARALCFEDAQLTHDRDAPATGQRTGERRERVAAHDDVVAAGPEGDRYDRRHGRPRS